MFITTQPNSSCHSQMRHFTVCFFKLSTQNLKKSKIEEELKKNLFSGNLTKQSELKDHLAVSKHFTCLPQQTLFEMDLLTCKLRSRYNSINDILMTF